MAMVVENANILNLPIKPKLPPHLYFHAISYGMTLASPWSSICFLISGFFLTLFPFWEMPFIPPNPPVNVDPVCSFNSNSTHSRNLFIQESFPVFHVCLFLPLFESTSRLSYVRVVKVTVYTFWGKKISVFLSSFNSS